MLAVKSWETFKFLQHHGGRTEPATPESPTLRIHANRKARQQAPQQQGDDVVLSGNTQAIGNSTPRLIDGGRPEVLLGRAVTMKGLGQVPVKGDLDPLQFRAIIASNQDAATFTRRNMLAGTDLGVYEGRRMLRISDVDTAAIQPFRPPPALQASTSHAETLLLQQLIVAEGLSEAEFQGLFVKCVRCRTHMTRRVVGYHTCKATGGSKDTAMVVGLTGDE